MAYKEIKTSIRIEASPETVWNILTDFSTYASWNPFLTSISGEQKLGAKLKVQAGGMKFEPIVLAYEAPKELRWLGKLLFKGLFDGEHSFVIEDMGDGTVNFLHEEKFQGLLVGFFSKKLDTETRLGFEQMNQKLKELAELKTRTKINAR